MTAAVTQIKIVEFPAGDLNLYKGDSNKLVNWNRTYYMIIPSGRRDVRITDEDITTDDARYAAYTNGFSKPGLRRCFQRMLAAKPGSQELDDRTGISWRRFQESNSFEIEVPCGDHGVLKARTIRRLMEHLK